MRKPRRHYNCEMGKNLKMNDEVYALRREVMNYVYEAKNLLRGIGVDMPRVDVRITDNTGSYGQAAGMGGMQRNIIWISTMCLNKWNKHVKQVVFHELLHALEGIMHDESCPLMKSHFDHKPLSEKVLVENFLKYFKKGEN